VLSSVTPSPVATPELTAFSYPIAGACLPSGDQLMPGAPRPYRDGIHEGVDFYDSDNCTAIGFGTEVLAAKDGKVVRVDSDYSDLTQAEVDEIDASIAAEGKCDEKCLDTYRGRQVWIDHGAGVITRYAHLSRVADGLSVGMSVKRGEVIGYVGNSGTPESLVDPDAEMHLHFEIRVGDSYLGQGLAPEEVRALYEKAFGP
jgi:murein DD-endopeptidase MepM/ murein hydrolase activator NlpD